jgi:hypothetical protein
MGLAHQIFFPAFLAAVNKAAELRWIAPIDRSVVNAGLHIISAGRERKYGSGMVTSGCMEECLGFCCYVQYS